METKGGRRELGQIEGLGVDTYTPLTLCIKGLLMKTYCIAQETPPPYLLTQNQTDEEQK